MRNDNKLSKMIDIKLLLNLSIIWYFSSQAIRFVMNNSIGLILSSDIVNFVYGTIFVLIVFLCLLLIKESREVFFRFSLLILVVTIFFLVTLFFHPEYKFYYLRDVVGIWYELYSPVTGCIYALLVVMMSGTAERLWRSITVSAWINLAYYSILAMSARSRGYWDAYSASGAVIKADYDLGLGYSLAFIMVVFLCRYLERRSKIDLIASAFSLLLAIQNGSRGALLSIFFAVLLIMICKRDYMIQNKEKRKYYLRIALTVALSLLIYFNYSLILKYVGEFLAQVGLSSRTIEAMINGTITEDNGRSIITERAYTAISEGGILGLGAYGDRPYISPYYWWGYSHNIFLEILSNFGLFFGSVLIIGLIHKVISILLKRNTESYTFLFIVFFSSSVKLFLSDTIWGYPNFWAFLGLLIMYPFYGKVIKKQ